MNEIWKRYDERYEVSSFGNVRNEKRLLKLSVNYYGYYQCRIHNGVKIVHKLVAICFLNHTPCGHKLVVDHIDNNKLNNHVSNLQLISQRLNSSKDKNTEFTGVFKVGNKFISQIIFNGNRIRLGTFNTPKEASEQYQNALISIENNTEIVSKKRIESSKYKGVCWFKNRNKWMVRYKGKFLGYFNTQEEAHKIILKQTN